LSVGKVKADSEGWVLATPRYNSYGIGLSADQERDAVARLRDRGLIDVKGREAGRYLRVNLDALTEIINDQQGD
jgi:hypothetical protein